jgi:hypothetical protein
MKRVNQFHISYCTCCITLIPTIILRKYEIEIKFINLSFSYQFFDIDEDNIPF